MTRRATLTLSAIALLSVAGTARAQRASLAIGALSPVGDLASTAGPGWDVQFQVRTQPIVGPLPLRIDLGYDFMAGKNGSHSTTISAESIGVMNDFGQLFYWVAGPGHYSATNTIVIDGHNAAGQQDYLGVELAVGMNIPVFRWDGFLEVATVRLFSPRPTPMYVPLRFGIRL